MRFLDIDLDAFLKPARYWPAGGRLDSDEHEPWTEARLRNFLEKQCGLSNHNPIPGAFTIDHDGAFDVMRELVGGGSGALEVIHVDAHADLGMGDSSWLHLIKHVAAPIDERLQPTRAPQGLHLGSWLAYALAAEFIVDLTFVHPAGEGKDLPPIHFLNMDIKSGLIQMKAYTLLDLPMMGSLPDFGRLLDLDPDVVLTPVPFRMETLDEYRAVKPFDFGFLCQSPEYTPQTSDALIPIIAEYVSL